MSGSMDSSSIRYEYKEDPQFTKTRRNLMRAKTFDGYDTQKLVAFYWKLRDHAYYCAIRGRYNDATEAERLLKYLKTELDIRGQVVAEPKQKSYVQELINEVTAEYEQKLKDFDEETQKRLEKMAEKHSNEHEQLNQSWCAEKLRPFMIPSVKLRNLKVQEKRCNTQGNYKGAKIIHEEIKKLELEEHEAAQEQANKQYNDEVAKLVQKQAEEKQEIVSRREYKRKLILSELEQQKREIRAHGARNIPSPQEKKPTNQNSRTLSDDFESGKIKITRELEKRNKPLLPPIRPPMISPDDWNNDINSDDSEEGEVCHPKHRKVKRIRSNSLKTPRKIIPENKKQFAKSLKLDVSTDSYNETERLQMQDIPSSATIEEDYQPTTYSVYDKTSLVAWEAQEVSEEEEIFDGNAQNSNITQNENYPNQNGFKPNGSPGNSYGTPNSSYQANNNMSYNQTSNNFNGNYTNGMNPSQGYENNNLIKSQSNINNFQSENNNQNSPKSQNSISNALKFNILESKGYKSNNQIQNSFEQNGFVVSKASMYSPPGSPSKGPMKIEELNSPSKDEIKDLNFSGLIQEKLSTIASPEVRNIPEEDRSPSELADSIVTTKSGFDNNNTQIQSENATILTENNDESISDILSPNRFNSQKSSDLDSLKNMNQSNSFNNDIMNLNISAKSAASQNPDSAIIKFAAKDNMRSGESSLMQLVSKTMSPQMKNDSQNNIIKSEPSNPLFRSNSSPKFNRYTCDLKTQLLGSHFIRSVNNTSTIIDSPSPKAKDSINDHDIDSIEVPPPKRSMVIVTQAPPISPKKLSFQSAVLADEKPQLRISDATAFSGNIDVLVDLLSKSELNEEEEEKSEIKLSIGGSFAQAAPEPSEPVVIDIGGDYEEEEVYEEEEEKVVEKKKQVVIQYSQRTPYFVFAPNKEVIYVEPTASTREFTPINSSRSTRNSFTRIIKRDVPAEPMSFSARKSSPGTTRFYD